MISSSLNENKNRSKVKVPSLKLNQGDLKLLLAELGQYLRDVRIFLRDPSYEIELDLSHKKAYIFILSQLVRKQYFKMEKDESFDDACHLYFHRLSTITTRLNRIAELALNAVRQCAHLKKSDFLNAYELDEFFDEIDLGLSLIRPALDSQELELATNLCQVEERLDLMYAKRFQRLIKEMEEGRGEAGDRVTTLMVVHYLERIGDSILEIGEEMIHAVLGEKLTYKQYQAITIGLKATGHMPDLLDFKSIWTGRSGCRIGLIGHDSAKDRGEPLIFKHGPAIKLEKEKDNLEIWGTLWPGLSPQLRAFIPGEGDGQAAILLEYIKGESLKDMFLNRQRYPEARNELLGVLNLMARLWLETREDIEVRARFARQAEKRLGSVEALYPDLVNFTGAISHISINPLKALLAEARILERGLQAPFTVRIHGDFNLSNVMHDAINGRHRLIDLYRSRLSDYVQDLSVMILSILRLSLPGISARDYLSGAALQVWDFAKNFADANADSSFEARMAFGLARSFLTSARFEPRRSVASMLIAHSRFLWNKIIKYGHTGHPWDDFRLDKRVLYM